MSTDLFYEDDLQFHKDIIKAMKRCDQCKFWGLGEAWGGIEQTPDKNYDPDDQRGTCRRNAPKPSGEFEYYVLWFLYQSSEAERGPDWEEFNSQAVSWPVTTGSDWCGEFSRKGGTSA